MFVINRRACVYITIDSQMSNPINFRFHLDSTSNLRLDAKTPQNFSNSKLEALQLLTVPLQKTKPRIAAYMQRHMIDAHLTLVQTCRICLAGFGLLAFAAAIGSPGNSSRQQRERMQCAAAAAACAISTWYYTRLYALRRLPLAMGYSLESNTVAESARYANWSVVIALLGWCAFLLRGPFQTETYGPFNGWDWNYETWSIAGPLLSTLGTMSGLPGWHASRAARSQQMQRKYRNVALWTITCLFFLFISASLSLIIGAAMMAPSPSETRDSSLLDETQRRTSKELALGRGISVLWFVYPIISLIRTLALMLGAGGWGDSPVQNSKPPKNPKWWALRVAGGFLSIISIGIINAVKSSYLALVTAPDCKSTLAVTRLTAMADGVHDLENSGEIQRLLPMSDLLEETDESSGAKLRMHIPEVSPLCSMGTDSILAVVDIMSQSLIALGCAAITIHL